MLTFVGAGGFATVPAYLAEIFETQCVGAIHRRLQARPPGARTQLQATAHLARSGRLRTARTTTLAGTSAGSNCWTGNLVNVYRRVRFDLTDVVRIPERARMYA